MAEKKKVISTVKDTDLIKKRREQMIRASIELFKQKGFHQTTTREIAKQSGFSIGTLYEYIRTKEDILFLVCDSVYELVHSRLAVALNREEPPVEKLMNVVELYFHIMDEMQEEVLILYQEVKSLKNESKNYIIQKELDMVSMLTKLIKCTNPQKVSDGDVEIIANNVFVQGQMWGFRRWAIQRNFTLEQYIAKQVKYLKRALLINDGSES
ncbi:MAG TPA: TetR/AcrR family transcriptional regulator [Bacillota bacterium]|nr:TetR/AcrR family transcriptional regulator [Bacillota bacterium]